MTVNLGIHQTISTGQHQTQSLVMTPAMVQAIRLLQLNSMELEQEIAAEMEENPFLEIIDEEESGTIEGVAEANGAEPESPQENSDDSPPSQDNDSLEMNSDSDGDDEGGIEIEAPIIDIIDKPDQSENNDENIEEFYELTYDDTRFATAEQPTEERDFLQMGSSGTTLYEHLLRQLSFSDFEGVEKDIAEFLIGNVDENGYLRNFVAEGEATDPTMIGAEEVNGPPPEDEMDILEAAALKFDCPREEIEAVLEKLQTFEPVGVFARSIQECLLIQIRSDPDADPALATLVSDHFEDLAHRRHKAIARAMKIPERRVVELTQRIAALEPKPGREIVSESPQYILPDVVVQRLDGRYYITLNEGRTDHLKISSYYRQRFAKALTIRSKGDNGISESEKDDIEFVRKKFNDAQTLIRNIERRKGTILKITHAIMSRQSDFLEKGIEHLRPMTLKDIAAEVGMHEATVSRVTSNKWVETPRGTFRLKYFFSSGLTSDDGESQSSRSVKNRIRQMIADENPKRPLSDQKIADLLKAEGTQIARRTVTKYREQLKILPTNMRRQ